MAEFNHLVRTLESPPIPLVRQWSEAYDGRFGPLLDLSQAVPDFRPPAALTQLLGTYAADPDTYGYGPIPGEPELRTAYAAHVSARYGATIEAANVQISAGCNQAFMAAMMALVGAGDKVLMCNPSYFNHSTTLAMLGLSIGQVQCTAAQGFVPDVASVEAQIDERTRALVLTSPNNPTGAVYSSRLMTQLLSLCQRHDLWLVIDETYRDFLAQANTQPHLLLQHPSWQQHVVQLYSFSKSFCIPGHRLGAVCAGVDVIAEIGKVMDNLQICAPRPAQLAVAQALPVLADWRESNRREIQLRASRLLDTFRQLPAWCLRSSGAYFAFVEHPYQRDSVAVAKAMSEQVGVSCLPGAFFGEGNERYLRFAFANVDSEALSSLPQRLQLLDL